jgi:hypothetical protein
MKLYKNPSSNTSFCNFYGFQCCCFLQHIYPYNYEHVWFVNVTSWTRANNENNDAHEAGKVENWTNIKQKIVIKHNFNNSGAIML